MSTQVCNTFINHYNEDHDQNMPPAIIIDPQQLKAEMAADDFTDSEVTAGKRKLLNFDKPVTQQNLTLVMSVARMLKSTGKNLTVSIFKNAEYAHVQSVSENSKSFQGAEHKLPRSRRRTIKTMDRPPRKLE